MLFRMLVRFQLGSGAVVAASLLHVPRTVLKEEDSANYVSKCVSL